MTCMLSSAMTGVPDHQPIHADMNSKSEMTATGFSVRMRQNICHASVRQGTRRNTECLVDAQMSRVLLV